MLSNLDEIQWPNHLVYLVWILIKYTYLMFGSTTVRIDVAFEWIKKTHANNKYQMAKDWLRVFGHKKRITLHCLLFNWFQLRISADILSNEKEPINTGPFFRPNIENYSFYNSQCLDLLLMKQIVCRLLSVTELVIRALWPCHPLFWP